MKIPEYKKKLMQTQTKSQRILKKFRSDLPDLNQTRQKKHLLIWILFADQIIIIKKKSKYAGNHWKADVYKSVTTSITFISEIKTTQTVSPDSLPLKHYIAAF